MIYMKILKKTGGSREKGEEETKSMPHAPVVVRTKFDISVFIATFPIPTPITYNAINKTTR
jgi:hypothetical protein